MTDNTTENDPAAAYAEARAEAEAEIAAADRRLAAFRVEHDAAMKSAADAKSAAVSLSDRAGAGESIPAAEVLAVRIAAKEAEALAEHHADAIAAAVAAAEAARAALRPIDRTEANRRHREATERRVKIAERLDSMRGEIEALLADYEQAGRAVADALVMQTQNGRADTSVVEAEFRALRDPRLPAQAVVPGKLQDAILLASIVQQVPAAAKIRSLYLHTYRDL